MSSESKSTSCFYLPVSKKLKSKLQNPTPRVSYICLVYPVHVRFPSCTVRWSLRRWWTLKIYVDGNWWGKSLQPPRCALWMGCYRDRGYPTYIWAGWLHNSNVKCWASWLFKSQRFVQQLVQANKKIKDQDANVLHAIVFQIYDSSKSPQNIVFYIYFNPPQYKMISLDIGILIVNVRRSRVRFAFMMWITALARRYPYDGTAHCPVGVSSKTTNHVSNERLFKFH